VAPAIADRLAPALAKAGTIGIGVVVVVALAKFYPALLNMAAWSYLVVAIVSATALAIGQFSGPDDPQERTAVAVECGVRHPSLAIAIGTANFGAEQTLPVLVPSALVFMVIATVYLSVRRTVTAS
jgi:predicted Na+-dependent transporter